MTLYKQWHGETTQLDCFMGREQDLLVIKLPKPPIEGREKAKMVGIQAGFLQQQGGDLSC